MRARAVIRDRWPIRPPVSIREPFADKLPIRTAPASPPRAGPYAGPRSPPRRGPASFSRLLRLASPLVRLWCLGHLCLLVHARFGSRCTCVSVCPARAFRVSRARAFKFEVPGNVQPLTGRISRIFNGLPAAPRLKTLSSLKSYITVIYAVNFSQPKGQPASSASRSATAPRLDSG